MIDIVRRESDHDSLFQLASSQLGYFTASQARALGFGWDRLSRNATNGRFIRVRRGLYRLRNFPSSPEEDVMAAWLATGGQAVVSHTSALELLGLSDVISDAVHVTVPRSRRATPRAAGVRVHTTTRPLKGYEVITRLGMPVTEPARTIADAAQTGTAPEQIEKAVRQAVDRGLTTPRRLREAMSGRPGRVRRLIEGGLSGPIV